MNEKDIEKQEEEKWTKIKEEAKVVFEEDIIIRAMINKNKRSEIIKEYLNLMYNDSGILPYPEFKSRTKPFLGSLYGLAFIEGYKTKGVKPPKEEIGEIEKSELEELRRLNAERIHNTIQSYTPTQRLIKEVTEGIRNLLFYKNEKYGDSALHPTKIFSKFDASNSICLRIDDKISRVMNGKEILKNDVGDLMGYLILLCASKGWVNFDEFKD